MTGNALARTFLARHQVPVVECGKVIVARAIEHERIIRLCQNASRNGAHVEMISLPDRRFPGVLGDLALYSPRTCVTDSALYLHRLHQSIESAGGVILRGRRFLRLDQHGNRNLGVIQTVSAPERLEFIHATWIVNCAGLFADEIASGVGLDSYDIRPVRGEYFRLRKAHPSGILVYPLPPQPGDPALGVHYTFHPSGEAYAGPNAVGARSKTDYAITASPEEFAESLSRIVDGYTASDLTPGYAGLRPRLFRKGEPVLDFVVEECPEGFFHFLGIESPGLTAAPSLPTELPFLRDLVAGGM